jgi:hypothetical protein
MDELDVFQRNRKYRSKIGKVKRVNEAPMKDLARQRLEILKISSVSDELRIAFETFKLANPKCRLPAIVHDHVNNTRYIITIGNVNGVAARWCTECLCKMTSKLVCRNLKCERNPDVVPPFLLCTETLDDFSDSEPEPPKKMRRRDVDMDELMSSITTLSL